MKMIANRPDGQALVTDRSSERGGGEDASEVKLPLGGSEDKGPTRGGVAGDRKGGEVCQSSE
jgi:hypothetical protein